MELAIGVLLNSGSDSNRYLRDVCVYRGCRQLKSSCAFTKGGQEGGFPSNLVCCFRAYEYASVWRYFVVVSVEEGMILSREVEIDWQVMASGCACLTKLEAGFPQWNEGEIASILRVSDEKKAPRSMRRDEGWTRRRGRGMMWE